MQKIKKYLFTVSFVFLIMINSAYASHGTSHTSTEDVKFTCEFTRHSSYKGNNNSQNNFNLMFLFDVNNNKAFIINSNNKNEVLVVHSMEAISFLEQTPAKDVTLTTIGSEKGVAVHSRHGNTLTGAKPSQHYGRCSVGR